MQKKLKELQIEGDQTAKQRLDEIKGKVADGSYFKDALDWYFFRYVTAICDRTILIFGGLIAAVVLYFLVGMINNTFPLVVKDPIFMRSKDQSLYFPSLVHLKPKPGEKGYDSNVNSVDEAVLKYLTQVYVRDREEYDFRSAEIKDVNRKFNRIKNISSEMEYRQFQAAMSKDNPESPINYFGLPVTRLIEVKSVKFVTRKSQDFTRRALQYITGKVPTSAEVRFVATKTTTLETQELETESQLYLARIDFSFSGVKKPEKNQANIIKFIVNNYQLFKIK
jgi:type IV secretory pathway component VirB8